MPATGRAAAATMTPAAVGSTASSHAATATEEIKAVDSLVRLHGLATPEKVEINITARNQLEGLDDEALLRMAGQTIRLTPEEYRVLEDNEDE